MAHIRRRPDRGPGVWQVSVSTGRDPVTRKYRQVTRTVDAGPPTKTGKPPKKVTDLAAKLTTEVNNGRHRGSDSTLGYLIGEYIRQAESDGRAPKTIIGYRSLQERIDDTDGPAGDLSSVPLSKLTVEDLDAFYRRLSTAGLHKTTRAHYAALISQALNLAVGWGWLEKNPAKHSRKPTLDADVVVPPTLEEVQALLDEAAKTDMEFACFIFCAAALGARRGELCGLRWSDIDFEGRFVVFRRSITDLGGGGTEARPRTKTNQIRRLAMGETTRQHLLDQYDRATVKRKAVGLKAPGPDCYVWSLEDDYAVPYRPDGATHRFEAIRDKTKLRHVHLHSLRHLAVTRALGAGTDVKTAASRFGHDPALMAKVYAHAIETADRAAADAAEEGLAL